MKRIGLVAALALVGFACADGVGQMLTDAGQMIEDAGTSMQDGSVPDAGAQDVNATCNKSATERLDEGDTGARTMTFRWAEFDIDPGATEVTTCHRGDPEAFYPYSRQDTCYRGKAPWYRGTSTGFVQCGTRTDWDDDTRYTDSDTPDPISITVHR
jgi:hypothetical protein